MGADPPVISRGGLGTRRFGGYGLWSSCTGVQEGAAAAWMDLGVVMELGECGRRLMSLSPDPWQSGDVWCGSVSTG